MSFNFVRELPVWSISFIQLNLPIKILSIGHVMLFNHQYCQSLLNNFISRSLTKGVRAVKLSYRHYQSTVLFI